MMCPMKTNPEPLQPEGIRILRIDNRETIVSIHAIVLSDWEHGLPQVTVNVKIQEEGLGATCVDDH
jgi:hypothetical protein